MNNTGKYQTRRRISWPGRSKGNPPITNRPLLPVAWDKMRENQNQEAQGKSGKRKESQNQNPIPKSTQASEGMNF